MGKLSTREGRGLVQGMEGGASWDQSPSLSSMQRKEALPTRDALLTHSSAYGSAPNGNNHFLKNGDIPGENIWGLFV